MRKRSSRSFPGWPLFFVLVLLFGPAVGGQVVRPAAVLPTTASITLVKLTNGTDNNSPPGPTVPIGSTVTFTYLVTNTGDDALMNVTVRDDNGTPGNPADDFLATFVGGDTDSDGTLDLTETWTFTASRIATEGQYSNVAVVTGIGVVTALPAIDNDPDNHLGSSGADINLVKLTNGTDNNVAPGIFVPVGSTVTFSYVVTNPGTVSLSGVTVRDNAGTPGSLGDDFLAIFVGGDTNGNGTLETTETWTFSASRIATSGQYTNIATASGTPAVGAQVTATDPDNHFGATPAVNIVKRTNGTDNNVAPGPVLPVGSTATFTYAVTNPGNVPLSGITVADDNGTSGDLSDDFVPTFTGGDAIANGLLDLSETWTYTASRIVTAGQYSNVGRVSGTPPPGAGPAVTDTDADNHFGQTSAINLVKRTNGTDNNVAPGAIVPVGSTVTFTYVVTNPGAVPLSAVTVQDNNGTTANFGDDFLAIFVGGDTDGDGLLDTTETWTFTASRIATAGQYSNLGTATGTPPVGAAVTDTDPDNHFGQTAAINLVKRSNGTDNNAAPGVFVPVGSTVTFTYVATNPGAVPLSAVTVQDDNGTAGSPGDDFAATFVGGDTNGDAVLDPAETWTFTASRIATAGQYSNIGTATGTPPVGPALNDTDSDNHFGSSPAINIVKLTNGTDNDSTPGVVVPVGSTVTFTYLVTNLGNVPLSSVLVQDDNGTPGNAVDDFSAAFAGGDANSNTLLDLSETWTFTASRIATAGQYSNIATATGQPPPGGGAAVSDTNPDNHFGGTGAIDLVKQTNGTDNNSAPGPSVPVGSTVTFTYVVTNPGTVALSAVTVLDDNGTPGNPADDFNATFSGGDANSNTLLDTTETWTFTANRIATAGQYTNTATATGTPSGGGSPVTDSDTDNHFGGDLADIPALDPSILLLLAAALSLAAVLRLRT